MLELCNVCMLMMFRKMMHVLTCAVAVGARAVYADAVVADDV